jgi:hypothetical protein
MGLAFVRHLRSPLDPDPEGTIRSHMENREKHFLAITRKVLSDAGHPYARMFRIAGCTLADAEASVARRGVEDTLQALLEAGVYLTQDEMRGRREIVRHGEHIPATPASWDNERGRGPVVNTSSGSSSGKSFHTTQSLNYLVNLEACCQLMVHELDVEYRPGIQVAPILPGYGLLGALLADRLRIGFERWYAIGGVSRANLHYRVATRCIAAQMRLFGAKVPNPTYLDQNDFRPAAEYLARLSGEGAGAVISGFVSSVSRVAAAAVDEDLDVAGAIAIVAGEALTDVKRHVIESAGISVYPTYGASDIGSIGYPCRHMSRGNSVHIFRHGIALAVNRQATADWAGGPVDSLYATPLLPFAPRHLINAEIGDTGLIEEASCDCTFTRLGFNLQVRDIAAISKVTAQGMTVAAGELVQILEERMPARFGGRPGDYQLIEAEGAAQTEMVLRIRPGACDVSAEDVLAYFLSETRGLYGGSMSAMAWAHSRGVRVELAPPVLSATGKFRAVRLLGPGVAATGDQRRSLMAAAR